MSDNLQCGRCGSLDAVGRVEGSSYVLRCSKCNAVVAATTNTKMFPSPEEARAAAEETTNPEFACEDCGCVDKDKVVAGRDYCLRCSRCNRIFVATAWATVGPGWNGYLRAMPLT